MAVPKRKTSKLKKRQRRGGHQKRPLTAVSEDKRDGGFHVPHRICPTTGMYKGRQVLSITTED